MCRIHQTFTADRRWLGMENSQGMFWWLHVQNTVSNKEWDLDTTCQCAHMSPYRDGRPLALEDIWEGVHECYKPRLLQGPWDTITQQEHPILGQPFFVLHPCKTNEFMTAVLKNSQKINRNVNYITSWLSLVGPVVGLNLPLSYAKATSQSEWLVNKQDPLILETAAWRMPRAVHGNGTAISHITKIWYRFLSSERRHLQKPVWNRTCVEETCHRFRSL